MKTEQKTICKEAERGCEQIHDYCNHIESYRQRKIDRIIVTLNQNEINKLKELVDLPCELENIRKWFLLGLNIGQRISDVLKITPQNLRQAPRWRNVFRSYSNQNKKVNHCWYY